MEITTILFQVDYVTKVYALLDLQINNWRPGPPPTQNTNKDMLLLFIKDVKTVLCVDRLTERSTVIFFLKKLLIEILSNHHNQQHKNNTIQKKILKKKMLQHHTKAEFLQAFSYLGLASLLVSFKKDQTPLVFSFFYYL